MLLLRLPRCRRPPVDRRPRHRRRPRRRPPPLSIITFSSSSTSQNLGKIWETTRSSSTKAFAGGPLVQARNFAVMTGVNAGISCAMKRIRGVDDVQTSMTAAFGSGAMFSLVSGMGGPNQAVNAVTSGLFFALIQGGLFKLGQKFSQPPAEDVFYTRTRSMLTNLGLQNYEKNFKKGLLTDSTLPLLTDSALRDVKIPPGPRLLILDHVNRDPELKARK